MRAKKIRELVKIVEESNIGELEVTQWLLGKIRITKTASQVMTYTTSVDAAQTFSASAPITTESKQAALAPVEEIATNQIEIKAPMVGTFYRSPSPDAEPYVKEGEMISPGKVLCIIEAMKLMNEIEAEVSGKIVKILVNDTEPVEYNQPLFLIEP